jgi:alpha-tubulin suppressor-like RCC1 family protein
MEWAGFSLTPSPLMELLDVKSAASGGAHILYWTKSNMIYSGGSNLYRQLCLGDTSDRFSPVFAYSDVNIKYLLAGFRSTAFLFNNGTYAWCGENVVRFPLRIHLIRDNLVLGVPK